MIELNIFTYLLLLLFTYLIFFAFFGILAIFGYVILFFLRKKKNYAWELSKLEYIFISFALGLSLYIPFSYCLDIFNAFNFFTAYLPIVIFDTIFIIYFLSVNDSKEIKVKFKRIFNFTDKSALINLLIICLIICLLFFRLWDRVTKSSSLSSADPYTWTSVVYYIMDNHHITLSALGPDYPPGYTFYLAGNILIFPSKTFVYFFVKFGCFPFLTLYILLMFVVAKRFFSKKYYLIFFCLISLLVSNYFLSRSLMFLPSSITGLLIFISLVLFVNKCPKYLIGIMLPSMYLLHNLTAFFFIICLIIFYLIKIISVVRIKNEFVDLLKEILKIVILTIILLIPYAIHASLKYNQNVIEIAIIIINKFAAANNSYAINKPPLPFLIYLNQFDYYEVSIGDLRLEELVFERTFGYFLIFSIIGLVLRSKTIDLGIKESRLMLKICFSFLILLFYAPYLLNIKSITNNYFYSFSSVRMIENFTAHIILLAGIAIDWSIETMTKIYQKIKLNHKKLNDLFNRRIFTKLKLNFKLILISLLIFSSFYYFLSRDKVTVNYHYNYFSENILYMCENIPDGANIAVRNFNNDSDDDSSNIVYRLLYNYDLVYYDCPDNQTYQAFYNFCLDHDIEYVLFKRTSFNETFLDEFDNHSNFELIYIPLEKEFVYGVYKCI